MGFGKGARRGWRLGLLEVPLIEQAMTIRKVLRTNLEAGMVSGCFLGADNHMEVAG